MGDVWHIQSKFKTSYPIRFQGADSGIFRDPSILDERVSDLSQRDGSSPLDLRKHESPSPTFGKTAFELEMATSTTLVLLVVLVHTKSLSNPSHCCERSEHLSTICRTGVKLTTYLPILSNPILSYPSSHTISTIQDSEALL